MDLSKAVFWNVDTQVDFTNEDGKFYLSNFKAIKNNLKKLTEFAKQQNIKVVNTMAWYDNKCKDISDSPDYLKTFPKHCMMNTEGVKFIDETSPDKDNTMLVDWTQQKGMNFHDIHRFRNIIIRKNLIDVFEGNSLTDAIVNNLGIPFLDRPTFIVYGIPTNTSVKSSVEGLTRRGYNVKVVMDAVTGLPNVQNPMDEWGENEMIELVTTEQVTKLQTV